MTGILYICATPIGNLEDITLRALRILKEADLIAAEDTRNTIHLLTHFEIKTPMTSYHEYNKYEKAAELVEKLESGVNIALVTDAGTPAISDPGEELVKQALQAGIRVVPVPGPSACIAALSVSGRSTRRFAFEAFLPREKKDRGEILESLKDETRTIIIYEAPHHLKGTLKDLMDALGDRPMTICRELTKVHEEIRPTSISDALVFYKTETPRGEYVLIIEGTDPDKLKQEQKAFWNELDISDHVKYYMDKGFDKKSSMKMAARDRGVSKSVIYNSLVNDKKKAPDDPDNSEAGSGTDSH